MSIRAFLFVAFGGLILMLGALFAVLEMLSDTQEEIAEAQRRRYQSYKLADELRQSSDDLTRVARLYISTGDTTYAEYFQEILDIRNGKQARPQDYDLVYWDLVLPSGERPRPDSQAIALEELMLEQGFTVREFAKLREARDQSDELVELEDIAINAVRGRFDDGSGHFDRIGEPDFDLARRIMFGKDYLSAKADIMEPINDFLVMLNDRTRTEVAELRNHGDMLLFTALGIALAAIGFGIGCVLALRSKIVKPLGNLTQAAHVITAGGHIEPIRHASTDEMGTLVQSFNTMVESTRTAMDNMTKANQELTEKQQELEDEKSKAEELLLNVMPSVIAERLKAGETTIADTFPEASVLFADLVGFTELTAEIGPYELVKLLNEIFGIFDRRLDDFGMEKIKTIGDAYMAVAGLPEPLADHAFRIGDFALAIRDDFARFAAERDMDLKVRIGIHSGTAIAGIVGTKKFAYDLWGDVVNVASRMETNGAPNKIHVTEAFMVRLKDVFEFEEHGEIDIKGKGLMKTYYLKGRRFG